MKLAEALLEKKNFATRIAELQDRYTTAAVVEEGSTPDEEASQLLSALEDAFEQWEKLTVSINLTNNQVMVGDRTMMQALAHRDSLKSRMTHFNAITTGLRSRNRSRFYNVDGPKMVVAEGVDTKYFIKLVDDLSKELRLLDAAIQAVNWANELTA